MLDIEPQAPFDDTHFSRRELEIMGRLAAQYRTAYAEQMIEATHFENLPWHKVYIDERRKQEQIPYEYALRAQERDEMLALARESSEVRDNFK
jgi:flagellar biosynthesis regulator FlaF